MPLIKMQFIRIAWFNEENVHYPQDAFWIHFDLNVSVLEACKHCVCVRIFTVHYYSLHSWSMWHLIHLFGVNVATCVLDPPRSCFGAMISYLLFEFMFLCYPIITPSLYVIRDQNLYFALPLCDVSARKVHTGLWGIGYMLSVWCAFPNHWQAFPKLLLSKLHHLPSGGRTLSFHSAVYTRAPLIQASICFLRPRLRVPRGKINILELHRHK